MKKGLLLSVIASTMIFAGGDIVPVEPVVAAPAADCSDFSGHVGLYYETSADSDAKDDFALFGKDATSLDAAASIHVEKEIAYGIGFGATAGGIAHLYNDTFTVVSDQGSLSEIYLTASFGNTAAKIGRFALPGSLSPLASADDADGVYTDTFQGILLANTDLADTTIYGAAITASVKNGIDNEFKTVDGDNNALLVAGLQNTSFAGTKISAVGYYLGSTRFSDTNSTEVDKVGAVLTVNTKIDNYGVDAQVAYLDGGIDGADATISAAIKVSGKYDGFSVWAQYEYVNDGAYGLKLFGVHESLMADVGLNKSAIKAGVKNIAIGSGTAYVAAEYDMSNADGSAGDWTQTVATVGYDFKYAGVNFNAEYEYVSVDDGTSSETDDSSTVSLSAVYKF